MNLEKMADHGGTWRVLCLGAAPHLTLPNVRDGSCVGLDSPHHHLILVVAYTG